VARMPARRRIGLAGLWVALVAAAAAACAAPQFNYVTNSGAHTYFKVPNHWHKIDDSSLDAALGGSGSHKPSGLWSVGYDAAATPTAEDVFSPETTQPFALALVAALSQTATNAMSYNELRDFFLPVTSATRQSATQSGFPLKNFQLLRDALLMPGQGVHGVRVTFDYTYPDGSTDTFDQVTFTNANDTEIYALVVHCLAACYGQHRNEINTVMTSFTVRSP
jgi:hypothetical protein